MSTQLINPYAQGTVPTAGLNPYFPLNYLGAIPQTSASIFTAVPASVNTGTETNTANAESDAFFMQIIPILLNELVKEKEPNEKEIEVEETEPATPKEEIEPEEEPEVNYEVKPPSDFMLKTHIF